MQTSTIFPQSTLNVENEIPFGIRAIERGVEVEGVYISRPTTPASSPGESRPATLRNEPATTKEIPAAHYLQQGQAPVKQNPTNFIPPLPWVQSANQAAWGSTFSFEKGTTPDYLKTPTSVSLTSMHPDLQSASQAIVDGRPENLQQPPRIFLIGSSDDALRQHVYEERRVRELSFMQEEPERVAGLVGDPSETSSKRRSSDESQQTETFFDDSVEYRGREDSRARLLAKDTRDRSELSTASRNSYISLDSMNAHRLLQAAETGQLTPRLWKNEPSPGGKSEESNGSNEEPKDYFSATSRQSSPNRATKSRYHFASGFQYPSRLVEAHRAVSFPAAVPAPESLQSTSTEAQATIESTPNPAPYHRSVSDPIVPHAKQEEDTELAPDQTTRSPKDGQKILAQVFEPESRRQVIRRINSGFLVLKPGTFPEPQPSPDDLKRPARKLQKKRTSTESSRERNSVVQQGTEDGRERSRRVRADSKESRVSKKSRRTSTESEIKRPERKLQKKR